MKKRILALVLALVLVLCLTACSGGGDSKKFVGKWCYALDLTDMMNSSLAAELDPTMAPYLTIQNCSVNVYAQFNEDGTYSMYVEERELTDTMDKLVADVVDGMGEYLVDYVYQETGMEMTLEEILEMLGMSMDDLTAGFDMSDVIDEMIAGVRQEGNYEAKDGKLFTSKGLNYDIDPNVYETYELGDNTITITGFVGGEAPEFNVYPMEFYKIG